jgi:hypothetical protein
MTGGDKPLKDIKIQKVTLVRRAKK